MSDGHTDDGKASGKDPKRGPVRDVLQWLNGFSAVVGGVSAIVSLVALYARGSTEIVLWSAGVLVAAVIVVVIIRLTSGRKMEVPLLAGIVGVVVLCAVAAGGVVVHDAPAGKHNPYDPHQQAILLDDPMTSSSGRWVNKSAGTGTCHIERDGLHADANDKFGYHECYSSTSVSDFTFEITFTFGSASGGGVFFRADGPGSWYNAQFSKDGYALISKGVKGISTNLRSEKLQRPDLSVPHTLAVVAEGNEISLYVDHERAVTVTDNSYSSGLIGVYTVNPHPGGETVFRNAAVWGP